MINRKIFAYVLLLCIGWFLIGAGVGTVIGERRGYERGFTAGAWLDR